MAGEGITANSPRRNLAILDERANDQRNRIDAIHQRFFNMRMKQQADINAFNKRIAQAGSQATLASVFQREQLMNKRMADIEAARAAYQQHYEQYGSALNESALKFLDQHAKIDVPTFTSIMAGYEHAKASAEQRDKERIDAQVAMAEKMGTLQAEQAKLVDERAQALIKPMIQDLENQKAMAAAQIEENKAYRDRLLGLEKDIFNAETRLLTTGTRGSGSGGAFSGAASAFNKANVQGSDTVDFRKKYTEMYGPNSGYVDEEMPEFSRFMRDSPFYSPYKRTPSGQIVVNYLTDYENGFAYKSLEKTNKDLYDKLEEKKKAFIEKNNVKGKITNAEDRALATALSPPSKLAEEEFINENIGKGTSKNYLEKLFESAVDSMLLAGYIKEVSAFANGKSNIDKESKEFGVINLANKLDAVARNKNSMIGKGVNLTDEEVKNLLPTNNMNVAAAINDEQNKYVFGMKSPEGENPYDAVMYSKTPEEFTKNWGILFPDNRNNPNFVTVKGYNELAAQNNLKYKTLQEANELLKKGDELGARNVMLRSWGLPEEGIQPQGQSTIQDQQEIINIITEEANRIGVDPQTMINIARNESGFNPNAVNKLTNASGLFQFIPSTWQGRDGNGGMVQKYGSQYGLDVNGVFDPRQNARASALYLKEHQDEFSKLGIPVNATSLYMGNFLGTAGAVNFFRNLESDPNQNAAVVVDKVNTGASEKNRQIFFDNGRPRTLQEVYNLMDKKMGGIGQQPVVQQTEQPQNIFGVVQQSTEPNIFGR